MQTKQSKHDPSTTREVIWRGTSQAAPREHQYSVSRMQRGGETKTPSQCRASQQVALGQSRAGRGGAVQCLGVTTLGQRRGRDVTGVPRRLCQQGKHFVGCPPARAATFYQAFHHALYAHRLDIRDTPLDGITCALKAGDLAVEAQPETYSQCSRRTKNKTHDVPQTKTSPTKGPTQTAGRRTTKRGGVPAAPASPLFVTVWGTRGMQTRGTRIPGAEL
ncbi:hypothetical protein O3P69_011548 [Scylla paramamosain]|uniref:Uncharacterized protein n=1 Tax=Scylla paramamosain TaxID=85552 RepID=A0AAW0T655_SCYPA